MTAVGLVGGLVGANVDGGLDPRRTTPRNGPSSRSCDRRRSNVGRRRTTGGWSNGRFGVEDERKKAMVEWWW